MRYAVFSDVHANRQAWETVLADIAQHGADVLVCLGDVVGYGPMPQAVLEGIGSVTPNFVLGNHDAAVCGRLDTSFFNPDAKAVIEWTREQLDDTALQFFGEVPLQIEEGDILFVHAEAVDPGRFGYVNDEASAFENLNAIAQRITFIGHTHHPLVHETRNEQVRELPPVDFALEEGIRYLVNVGSVGEPRTPDLRSSYVIYDSDAQSVTFRKLTFDVDAYREDLALSGLRIQPYFVQVVAYGEAAGGGGATDRHGVETECVGCRGHPATASAHGIPSGESVDVLVGGAYSAIDYYRGLQKKRSRSRMVSGTLLLLLILGIGAGAIYFLMETGTPKTGGVENAGGPSSAATPAAEAEVEAEVAPPNRSDAEPEPIRERLPLASDLVSYWPFDGAEMGSERGTHAAVGRMEGDLFGVEGRFRDAYHFGEGSIEMEEKDAYAIGTAGFAASLWFTLPERGKGESPGSPEPQWLVSAGAGSDTLQGWAIWIEGGTLNFAVSNGEERKYIRVRGVTRGGDEQERWRHVAVAVERDRQFASIYVDGELAEEALLTVLASGDLGSSSGLSIGSNSAGTQYFNGKIDDVGIWRRALRPWKSLPSTASGIRSAIFWKAGDEEATSARRVAERLAVPSSVWTGFPSDERSPTGKPVSAVILKEGRLKDLLRQRGCRGNGSGSPPYCATGRSAVELRGGYRQPTASTRSFGSFVAQDDSDNVELLKWPI